jgi:UDP-N-acetylmuramoyl-tripeptide--D-alanyl-D-alanine ligase
MLNINTIINLWLTPKLPEIHRKPKLQNLKGSQRLRVIILHWLIHPIKRRVSRYYLIFLQRFFGITVIGITGSTGKSTTKEMVASILRQKGNTIVSYANIDPVYNIPTTILKCTPNTKYLVLEMGVEYPGEMDYYLWLAKPSIGVITNIYLTHTEFFNDIEGVAKEKIKLIQSLGKQNFAVLNKENIILTKLSDQTRAQMVWFGENSQVSARGESISEEFGSRYTLSIGKFNVIIQIPVPGKQFISDSLAAASVGHILGASLSQIKIGLERFETLGHRMKLIKLKSGALILDDTYNNNPAAARESINTFVTIAGKRKKIIVMGDMLELGSIEVEAHRQLGEYIGQIPPDYLFGIGKLSKIMVQTAKTKIGVEKTFWVNSSEEALPLVKKLLNKNYVILVKGSRGIGLDRLIERLS